MAQALLGPEGQALVEGVHYNAHLQRLMVVLREGTPEDELLALRPDSAALLAAATDGSIRGISVTMAAGEPRCLCSSPQCAAFARGWLSAAQIVAPAPLWACMAPASALLSSSHAKRWHNTQRRQAG